MFSASSTVTDAAAPTAARGAWAMRWTSGWFWLFVPARFHVKATASRRTLSTPISARWTTLTPNSWR
ncbi:hypothetical protein BH24ACT5_BH24ACT5_06100 [soil metagenome]